jgi:lipid-binding SYLF domain-containing protein
MVGRGEHLMMHMRVVAAAVVTVLVVAGDAASLIGGAGQNNEETDEAQRVSAATAVFQEIMSAEDKAIPQAVLGKAEGIAVFPSTFKAGFVVGGMRGRGILSARGQSGTWSAPAFLTLTGGSVGLQIGGQATDLVLVIIDRRGLENLVRNQFKIGADASVAAGPVGRDAQAATDIQLRAQILSYSRARGVFAGISITGSTIRQDIDANGRFYGRRLETRQIVFERLGGVPEPVAAWREMVGRYAQ